MDRLNKAFNKAKRSSFVPTLIFFGVSYILYYSVVENSYVAITICIVGLLFTTYFIVINLLYNRTLSTLRNKITINPEDVRKELIALLNKIDKHNERFANHAKGGMIGKTALGSTLKIEKDNNMHKRNIIAQIIYELNLYIKNNIK